MDHNKIEEILNISYLLKITKLIIVILNFSYLLAMFWYILCRLAEDYNDSSPYKSYFAFDYEPVGGDPFIVFYGL